MRPGGGSYIVNQAAQRVARSRMYAAQTATRRGRIITPPSAALAQVVEELVQAPLTDEEMRLLTEVASATDVLEVERIGAELQGTRIWEMLRILANNDVRILTYVMVLLMIIQLYSDRHSPQTTSPPPPPAPQVTVTVTVPVDEIVKQIEERLEKEQWADAEPRPEGHSKEN